MSSASRQVVKGPADNSSLGKYRISQPGDALELEADRIADEVLRMPDAFGPNFAAGAIPLQRKCAACEAGESPCPACSLSAQAPVYDAHGQLQRKPIQEEGLRRQPIEEEEEGLRRQSIEAEEDELQLEPLEEADEELQLQRQSSAAAQTAVGGSPKSVEAVRSGGEPLPNMVRDYFEPRFGVDLGGVRLNTGEAAARATAAVNARAFTLGNSIAFAPGQFDPAGSRGRRLLAHELTHVLQQNDRKVQTGGMLQRDATSQSITPEYAAALGDEELQTEMLAVAGLLEGNDSQEFDDALLGNLLVLKHEYFDRDISAGSRTPEQFQEGSPCYNREIEPWTMVVDAHVHYEPFGGASVPTPDLYDYFRGADVMATSAYGIGQTLPESSECTYYRNCPWVPVTPSLKNDFVNASNLMNFDTGGVHTTISMTFPNPAEPEDVMWKTRVLDIVFPDTFKGMGEVNLVKQALFENWHIPTPAKEIANWSEFMAFLRDRNMPIAIHADLGGDPRPWDSISIPQVPWQMHDQDREVHVPDCKGHACHSDYGPGFESPGRMANPLLFGPTILDEASVKQRQTQYLPLLEEVLRQYPDNKIVWMHMGLSEELVSIDPDFHIQILTRLLNTYDNLMLDISWKVLFENYFDPKKHPKKRAKYVDFFNSFPNRVITGTDFIADEKKSFEDYQELVRLNSDILRDLSGEAFRKIALGENYYRLYSIPRVAPDICAYSMGTGELVDWVQHEIEGVSRK